MNIITKIIFFIIIVFTLNIIFYYSSDDYRFFVKKIKNKDEVIYVDSKEIDDQIKKIEEEENKRSIPSSLRSEELYPRASLSWAKLNSPWLLTSKEEVKKIEVKKELVLWKNYKTILNSFINKYDLSKLELNWNLFDLTDEYPNEYYEYYSPDLTLYLFIGKSYTEVKDIIDVISYEIPYELNEVNNFLDNSFYINLDERISDNFIRIVIWYKSITFWLKIKKDVYNEVKEILKQIPTKSENPTIEENSEQIN